MPSDMPREWNVLIAVVDLIPAKTGQEAIATLHAQLTAAGFDVYEGQPADAFESEDTAAGRPGP